MIHTESKAGYYTVRLARRGEEHGLALTYHSVAANDADHAAALAVRMAEDETGESGFVLDGPVGQSEVADAVR